MEEAALLLALQAVPGVGSVIIKQLVHYCGTAKGIYHATSQELQKIPGMGKRISGLRRSIDGGLKKAQTQVDQVRKYGGDALAMTSPGYPAKLKEINDCPPVLFSKGDWDAQNSKAISIVGTRDATDYGKKVVEELVEGLAPYRPLIVSGLAYGIDLQAHKQALKRGLQTVGVMGSGLDVIYPKIHTKVAHQMLQSGGLVTEHPLGTKPDAPHFPMRNRIIAGMTDAVIVVEAGKKGGALITAELANGYGRDVLAVPGNLHASYSEGCNALIRSHKANILTNPDDVAYLLNWPETKSITPETDLSSLSQDEQRVVALLKTRQEGMHIDELSIKSTIPNPVLAGILLQLEFADLVRSLPGKIYKVS